MDYVKGLSLPILKAWLCVRMSPEQTVPGSFGWLAGGWVGWAGVFPCQDSQAMVWWSPGWVSARAMLVGKPVLEGCYVGGSQLGAGAGCANGVVGDERAMVWEPPRWAPVWAMPMGQLGMLMGGWRWKGCVCVRGVNPRKCCASVTLWDGWIFGGCDLAWVGARSLPWSCLELVCGP